MPRPRPDLHLESQDKLYEWIAIAVLALTFLLPIYHYSSLPEMIPIHFNASGEADSHGHKSWVWLLPLIATALLLFMRWAARIPHQFNYTVKVTEANAEQLYRTSARMIRTINIIMMLIFCYLCYAMIMVAKEQMAGLSKVIMFALLLSLLGIAIGGSIQLRKIK